jgi:hypothetical protein
MRDRRLRAFLFGLGVGLALGCAVFAVTVMVIVSSSG